MTTKSQDPTAPGTTRSTPSTGGAGGATDRFGNPADPSAAPSQPTSAPAGDSAAGGPSPADAIKGIKAHLAEAGEYVGYDLATKVDGVKVSVRNAGIYAALGVVGFIAASAFVTTTVVLFCVGVAAAFTRLFNGRIWAGTLLTAVLFMAILAGAIWFGLSRLTKASRERMVRKYASRQQQQRANFGTDVEHRAANPADPTR